jgi:GPH family glycoside/pentoside/hexuronide:cation symporter
MADRLDLPTPRLSAGQKAIYGVGELIVAMRLTCFQFYLLPFYTDVVVLAPALAGLGKMLGLVWDAVNDPITGWFSDRTTTRLGRRRPYLLAAALPMGITFGLVWSAPASLGPLGAFVYLVLAYVVLDTCFTVYATPYLALGAELSDDYHERTQVAATRAFFHVIGLFVGGILPGIVLSRYVSAPATGYAVMGFGLGALMTVIALATGLGTREPRRATATGGDASWRELTRGLASVGQNGAFRTMIGTFALILLAGGIHQTLVPYAFRYWLLMPERVNAVIGIYQGAMIVSIPLWTRLAARLGKDRAFRVCMLWATVGLAVLPFAFAPGMGWLRLGSFLVLAGLGNGGWAVLPVSITADIVDDDELTTARRREGSYFGVWTLSMKLAAALASGLVGLALQLLGYVPNVEQTPATIRGIQLLYGPLPAFLLLLAFFAFRPFPLTRERHRDIQRALAARRETIAGDERLATAGGPG